MNKLVKCQHNLPKPEYNNGLTLHSCVPIETLF